MTVCVAALASMSRSIVCIADKALSYGDQISWDSDGSKMFELNPSGTIVMFAGGERDISEVVSRILVEDGDVWTSRVSTRQKLKAIFRGAIDETIDTIFLAKNQIKRDEYVSAISRGDVNSFIMGLADQINRFEFDCSLLVAGFDNDCPYLICAEADGMILDMTTTGFHAIGSGNDKAIARLLFNEHKRIHDIERVIYDCFDAKANAEMTATVGYEWDAKLIFPPHLGNSDVPKEMKELLEKAWSKFNRSPFEKFDPKEHWSLPKNWKAQLWEYSNSQIIRKMRENSGTIPSTLQTSLDQQMNGDATPSGSQTLADQQ
jgi:hypothetical protein